MDIFLVFFFYVDSIQFLVKICIWILWKTNMFQEFQLLCPAVILEISRNFTGAIDSNKLGNGDKLGKLSPIYKEQFKNLQEFEILI